MSRRAGAPATRVTFIGSLPPHKGVSPYCLDLATAIARRDDVELDVLSFRSLYPGRFYPGGSPSDGSQPCDVPGARTRRALTWWNPIGWLMAGCTLRGDVVHAQWWSFVLAPIYLMVLALARLRGKRVVLTVHNVEPHEGGVLRRLANRVVLPLAHRIVVHTQQNAQELSASGVSPECITVIPHGINTPEAIDPSERAIARTELAIPTDTPLALFLGNIRPYKGLDCLVDAFKKVAAAELRARLAIVGQPWGPPEQVASAITAAGLEAQVLTRLTYVSADEMRAYYAAADVVVYPYVHFGAQSGAACDALRYGRAIVVSRVGGLPDLVADQRAIVPPGDAGALGQALVGVLTDDGLRESLEADSLRIAASCTWEMVAARSVALYEEQAQRPVTSRATRGQES